MKDWNLLLKNLKISQFRMYLGNRVHSSIPLMGKYLLGPCCCLLVDQEHWDLYFLISYRVNITELDLSGATLGFQNGTGLLFETINSSISITFQRDMMYWLLWVPFIPTVSCMICAVTLCYISQHLCFTRLHHWLGFETPVSLKFLAGITYIHLGVV